MGNNPFEGLNIDETVDKLIRWRGNPESEPELERWYKDGCPPLPRTLTQEEIEFKKYAPLFEKGRAVEKAGKIDSALRTYLSILKKYRPVGLDYYTRPAIILEKQKKYEEAIRVCEIALFNREVMHSPTKEVAEVEFTKRIARLHGKISKLKNPGARLKPK